MLRTTMRSFTSIAALVWLCTVSACATTEITINATDYDLGEVYPEMFGAQISLPRMPLKDDYVQLPQYPDHDHSPARDLWVWRWYVPYPDPETDWKTKDAVKPILQSAIGQNSLIRVGGDYSDWYHWRRGVGWPINDLGVRPHDPDPWGEERPAYGNEFGIDELDKFIEDSCPSAEPIITVNWWGWYKPGSPNYDPDKGIREAANWVEYCNRSVTDSVTRECLRHGIEETHTILVWASEAEENWGATVFKYNDQLSKRKDAEEELAEYPKRSWYSWQTAPKGYFAWLRYHYAVEVRGVPDPGPYNIIYWEIGNEPAWRAPSQVNQAYEEFLGTYCEAVRDYAEAMRAASPNFEIKIGAALEDRANRLVVNGQNWEPTDDPDVCDWDTAIIGLGQTNPEGRYIDYVVMHPYAGGNEDPRYSMRISLARDPGYDSNNFKYQAVELSAGANTFWVRAEGTAGGGSSPRMAFYLIPCSGDCTGLTTNGRNPLTVKYGDTPPGVTNEVYVHEVKTKAGTDYAFQTDENFPGGSFVPWVKLLNEGDSRSIEVQGAYYQPEQWPASNLPTDEKVLQFRQAADQTDAAFAQTVILGRRLNKVRQQIDTDCNRLLFMCTEFGYHWSFTAQPDQTRTLKGVISNADLYKEMFLNHLVYATYNDLHGFYFDVAQVKSKGAHNFLGNWEPDQDPSIFFPSPMANLMGFLRDHMQGCKMLDTQVTAGSDVFSSPAYSTIVAMTDIPYLSAIAFGDDWHGETPPYFGKVYVMVINKDRQNNRIANLNISNWRGPYGRITWHTLKCWGGTMGDPLDAQNTFEDPDRISFQSIDEDYPETYPLISHTFPAASVTVLEMTCASPGPPYHSIGCALAAPNGSVDFSDKYVTAKFGNKFYIEEPLRTAGIGVMCEGTLPTNLVVGSKVSLTGTLGTDDGERMVTASASNISVTTVHELRPLGMRNEWLTGSGLYNVGLLVQTWGRVTAIDPGNWFYIDDGSNVWDGSQTDRRGIRVLSNESVSLDDYVRVTGIRGATTIGLNVIPVIRASADKQPVIFSDTSYLDLVADCWNPLSLPGIPQNPAPEAVFVGDEGHPLSLPGNLVRYDAVHQNPITYQFCEENLFGNCLMGEGYTLYVPNYASPKYSYTRAKLSGDQWISLPSGSDPAENVSWIGNPFTSEVSWSVCSVTDGVSLLSLPEAVSSGWLYGIGEWDWIYSTWVEVDDLGTGHMGVGKAYVVAPLRNDLALIVPDL